MGAFRIHFLLLTVITLAVLTGQDSAELEQLDRQIKSRQGDLEGLREEIRLYETRIAEQEQAEADALNTLYELEERISLTHRLIMALDSKIDELSGAMEAAEIRIREEETTIAELKEKLGERFAHIYKQRRASMLELILTSQNWHQATYRSKYLRVAAEYDRFLTAKVKLEVESLQGWRKQLAQDRLHQQGLRVEMEVEEAGLQENQARRRTQIDQIKQDRRNDERLLVASQRAAVQMERLVTNLLFDRDKRALELAELRRERDLNDVADITFYEGKLPWPVRGRVITPFGEQHNRELNTVTDFPGIDIQSPPGAPVAASLDGLVISVTYMRGYGTILIIDHGKDLLTVYAHLEQVEVAINAYVDQGQVIAHVGGNGTLDGAKLHFEVWVAGENQDPLAWLVTPIAQR